MDITVKVVNQELKIATNLRCLTEGTQEFVKFVFQLGDDWDGLTTFAQFSQGANAYNQYLDSENSAFLPHEVKAGKCKMLLYGTGGDVIATTNFLTLTINESGFVEDAQSTVITKSLYDQLVDKVAQNMEDFEAELEALETEVMSMVGTPLVANTASQMTDHNKIYVYTGSETGYQNGYWYYWNGSAWTAGGVYNAVAIDVATLAEIQAYIV